MRTARRIALAAALALTGPVVVAIPASSQTAPSGSGGSGGGGLFGTETSNANTITVGAQSGSASPGSAGAGHSGSPGGGGISNCTWMPAGSQASISGYDQAGNIISGGGGYDSAGNTIGVGVKGTWYAQSCGGHYVGVSFVPTGSPPPAALAVSPAALAAQGRSQLVAAAPLVQMSPASTSDAPGAPLSQAHWQYVNIPAWVWLQPAQWVPLHATANVPGLSVTATATPVQLVLSYQDGMGATRLVTCNGPGTPYSDQLAARQNSAQPILAASPTCGWVWQHSAAGSPDQKLEMTAHVVYDVTWTVTGAPGGGPLPPLNSATSTYRVVVGEIEALIGPSR